LLSFFFFQISLCKTAEPWIRSSSTPPSCYRAMRACSR
jgi:hypothetical protein